MTPDEIREAIRQGLLHVGQDAIRPQDASAAVAANALDIPRGTRCVLCHAGLEILVFANRMIIGGATYAETYRSLSVINENRVAAGDTEISYQTVVRHGRAHLPAKAAAIREVIERRARALQLDVEEGTASIVTAATLAEAMMVKAMQGLAEVEVTPAEGLQAAKFYTQLMQAERGAMGLETAFAELGYLIEAVKESVPQQYWSVITAKIEEKRGSRVIEAEVTDEFDPGDDPDDDSFEPSDDGDED